MAIQGGPSYSEYVLGDEQLWGFFKEHDKNGNGRLDKTELKEAFKRLGAILPSWRASRVLRAADADGDGCISVATDEELDELVVFAIRSGYTVQ